ncbi:MAG: alpha/beta hydrolase [Chloroflexi bacterium]|nr:alpha/beta hydrolase [Chloroflexota bacterium]
MARPASVDERVTHHEARVNGVRLHYVEAGTGPLVVLLHGFPEHWYSWRHQIPALADAGFRAAAVDLRGAGASERPRGARAYRVETLADDVTALVEALGEERAALLGHDWGGGVAWVAAMRDPARVERLAILNAPHPDRFARSLRRPRQALRSWYIGLFQLPWLPEVGLRTRGYRALRRAFERDARPGAFTPADVDRLVAAAAEPGALTAMLNPYRALRRRPSEATALLARVEQPVLVIWGERDPYLGRELAQVEPRWAPRARTVRLPEAGHFVHAEEPERVNHLLVDFLREPAARG